MAGDARIFGPAGFAASRDDLRDWLLEQRGGARAPGRLRYRFAIELLDEGSIIGSARLFVEERITGVGSIGYALAPAFRGRGYATEAARLVVAFGFEQLSLHRLDALIEPGNTASVRVAARLGMRRGELLEGVIETDGGPPRDAVRYSLAAAADTTS